MGDVSSIRSFPVPDTNLEYLSSQLAYCLLPFHVPETHDLQLKRDPNHLCVAHKTSTSHISYQIKSGIISAIHIITYLSTVFLLLSFRPT